MTCIPPTLEGWVYIIPIHGHLDEPLYTWAQYTPTTSACVDRFSPDLARREMPWQL